MAEKARTEERSAGTATQAELIEAMRHPLRAEILIVLSERIASARGLESELTKRHEGVTYETIAYHFRKLQALNCIELVREDKSRGGAEKFFRATVRAVFDTADVKELSRFSAQSQYVSIAQTLVGELSKSLDQGLFVSEEDSTLLRTVHLLDKDGLHKLGEMMLDFNERLIELDAESAERRLQTGEEALPVTTGLLAFVRASRGA